MTTSPSISDPAGQGLPDLAALTRLANEFYREPAAVFWVYGFPLLIAVALGIAFRDRPVERPTTCWADSSGRSEHPADRSGWSVARGW